MNLSTALPSSRFRLILIPYVVLFVGLGWTADDSHAEAPHQGTEALALPSGLWFIDEGDLHHVVDGQSQQIPLGADVTVQALATDPLRGRVFAVAGQDSWALSVDEGTVEAHWSFDNVLDDVSKDLEPQPGDTDGRVNVIARVLPEDGSLWIARGRQLDAFNAFGQPLHSIEMDDTILDIEIDATTSRLWVATPSHLELRDAISGEALHRVVLPTTTTVATINVADLAIDSVDETVWLTFTSTSQIGSASQHHLWRLDVDGEVQYTEVLEAPLNHITTDTSQRLWGLREHRIVRLEGADIVVDEVPFSEDRPLRHLVVDQAGSLWVSDGQDLAQVDGEASALLHTVLSPSSTIEALAFVETADDLLSPQIVIEYPHEGEIIGIPNPTILLSFEHPLAIDAQSVEILNGEQLLRGQCTLIPDGATCRLGDDLAEGPVNVQVSVADIAGRRSARRDRTFTIDLSFSQPPDDPTVTPTGDGTSSTYTPVVSPRGIHPEKVYHAASDIDLVDTSSGNLTLRVPLGQAYSVGPKISYRFQLTHNSNLWDHIQTGCPVGGCPGTLNPITLAIASANHNAGFGWEMHFGRLYAPLAPSEMSAFQKQRWPNRGADEIDGIRRWMYVAPDGGTHTLHDPAGRNNGTTSLPVRYSTDGSFLRMRQISATTIHLQMPDGRTSVFQKTSQAAGTNFCGGNAGGTGCWRFQQMFDPYGNTMSVAYAINGSSETWTVSDSTGRSHVLTFDRSNAATAGGDSTGDFQTEDGDEWGDLVRVLKIVDLAAFNSSRAVYQLSHEPSRLNRGCPSDTGLIHVGDRTQRVPLLRSVSVPGSQPWRFSNIEESGTVCSYRAGRIEEVTLPTRGKVKYEWAINKWDTPTLCSYDNDPDAEFFQRSTGIFKRREYNAADTLQGTWTYSSQLFPVQQDLVRSGDDCTRATYRRTDVSSPAGYDGVYRRTQFFNAVTNGREVPSATDPINDWQVTDRGLPLTKSMQITGPANSKRFLSRKAFECRVGQACATGAAERETWVRYASEWQDCTTAGDANSPGCYQINPLRTVERTIFKDDSNRYVERRSLRYDGAGHFERSITTDNFAGTNHVRTADVVYGVTGNTLLNIDSTTGYVDVGIPQNYLPNLGSPWILTPFSQKSVTENGRTYVSDHVFDGKGSLKCSRSRRVSGGQGPHDRVVFLDLNSQGLPITETVAGGDPANLGTGACNVNGGGSAGARYDIQHTYQSLTLASSRIGNFPHSYRADIDPNTGLPKTTYSPSDQPTTYQFDGLSRPTRIFTPLGAADTWITYSNPTNADPFTTTQQRQGSTILRSDMRTYDWNGRVISETTRQPTGASTWSQSEVRTQFDKAGRVERVTTRQPSGGLAITKATVYSEYDVFDRPQRIKRPDDTVENRAYLGVRQTNSTVQIRTSTTGSTSSTTSMTRDAQGRTMLVSNPEYNTRFTYDPYGQQLTAERFKGPFSQTRTYGFDGRGFMLSESLPEIDGQVNYTRDAFGQVRRKVSGQFNLTYVYDNAARLTQVKNTFGGRVWKEWEFGTSNASGDIRKGQVVRAVRHNYPFEVDWSVVETYTYSGTGGLLSEKTIQLQWPANPLAERYGAYLKTGISYDALGNLTSLDYPRCLPTPQNGQNRCADGSNDQAAPVHILNHTYSSGLPWKSQSSLGPWAQVSYHPNLQLATLNYSNGVIGSFDQGTNGMARSRRHLYTKNGAKRFDTFAYNYDGAGNIWQIGADRYVYDKASRLLSGTVVKAPGSGQKEEYTYDPADNILSLRRDGGALVNYQIDDNTNRLIGNNDVVHDASGHMLEVGPYVGGLARFEMEYDALGMQTRFISRQTGAEADYRYLYGPGDRRLVTFDTTTGERVFKLRGLGDEVLREYSVTQWGTAGGGNPGEGWVHEKDLLYGPEGVFATRNRTGSELTFLHKDHLGTPRVLTNHLGNTIGQHDYYPFGLEAPRAGQADEPTKKYTGHERDPHGLADYMLGRTYLYPFMRFATPDPARDGWSLYAYTKNNPINYVDPDGQDALAVTFVGYEISTPFGKRALGHSGIALSNEGRTKYYEFGRYNSPRGKVRYRGPLPDLKLGKNGVPTKKSLKRYLRALTKMAGQNKPVEGAYFVNDEVDKMLKYAKERESEAVSQGDYFLPINNCATFCEDTLEAGGEELDTSIINTPENVIQELQDRADFSVYYDPAEDELTVSCEGKECPE